ncbi:MAG: hypothetical protein ACREYF_09220 [Gammaproteobacteria bacterium]
MITLSSLRLAVVLLSLFFAASSLAASTTPVQYQDGRLSARVENRPLAEVLHALSAVAGARFTLSDPGSGQARVSAAVESVPFVDGVKRILEGFSYAIYPIGRMKLAAVIVLSTPRADRGSGIPGATQQGSAGVHTAATPGLAGLVSDVSGEVEQAEARDRMEREETLNHAIAALNPEAGKLNQQALDQITGIRDPRATQALAQAASGTLDSHARAQATEALWHHAADLQFADEATVGVLEQLATDTDARVQKTARQALEDMQQFRQRNAAP